MSKCTPIGYTNVGAESVLQEIQRLELAEKEFRPILIQKVFEAWEERIAYRENKRKTFTGRVSDSFWNVEPFKSELKKFSLEKIQDYYNERTCFTRGQFKDLKKIKELAEASIEYGDSEVLISSDVIWIFTTTFDFKEDMANFELYNFVH